MKKRKLKRKFKILLNRILFILLLFFTIFLIYKVLKQESYIENIEFKDNKAIIYLKENDLSCILSNSSPTLESKWIKSNDQICKIDIKNNINNLYILKKEKIIDETNNILYYELYKNSQIYLANNEEYNYIKYLIGDINKLDVKIENDGIISYSNGIVKGIKDGNTNITFKYKDLIYTSNIEVTSIINKMSITNKKALSCEKYSKEENDLLDKILKNRIENVGYKTRAGVVEAARFLALSFPYKIEYFYENGRQTTNNVDGEGRYYHEGLYLDLSRFESLTGSSYTNNKGIWGCKIYSYPDKKKDPNGLDCSGFVSWALLNGGFDVKDVGAGWSDSLDLTDYGDVKKLNSSNYSDIRVGDLLHSERLGGHIGIIIGVDNDNFYVAQAIWYDENGLVVTKIKKKDLYKDFPHVVLMDKYYEKDGLLTNMWN